MTMRQTIKNRPGIPESSDLVQQAFTGTSANVALPANASRVRLAATEDCYYLLTSSSTDTVSSSTGVWLPAGVEEIGVGNYTYIAVIRDTTSGTLHIARLA